MNTIISALTSHSKFLSLCTTRDELLASNLEFNQEVSNS